MDVELALKINKLVHNECKDVPHDIGIRIEEIVRIHQSEINKKIKLIELFQRLEEIHSEICSVDDMAFINYELSKLDNEEWDYLKG